MRRDGRSLQPEVEKNREHRRQTDSGKAAIQKTQPVRVCQKRVQRAMQAEAQIARLAKSIGNRSVRERKENQCGDRQGSRGAQRGGKEQDREQEMGQLALRECKDTAHARDA